ncbi:MAG: Gfo/Idh/MocA family oxidoreductase [Ignavibacteriaceae bacterium]|nr:Gfo/Idh/MocA family oxidoreductase [Ignavibacteriaceae bacterium]
MTEQTKIAVIGLGGVAQLIHLPNLLKINNVSVSAVAEINKNRLNTIADKFNIKERYTDYKELLAKNNCDAIVIATPTSTHKDVAIDCFKAKKHVLVEKPLARTYAEAKQVLAAAKKSKKKLMVGMNLRFRPDAMLLRSLICSGEIGEPFYVKCGWIRRQSSNQRWFTRKTEAGGGVIFDLGISMLDLSLWLLDYPSIQSISTRNFNHNTKDVEDTSISFLKFSNTSVISLETSWSLVLDKDDFYVNVYGTKGYATLNPFRVYKRMEDQTVDLSPSQPENPLALFKKSYINELKTFIGAVRDLNPLFSSGDEALLRMQIIDSMYKSSFQNKEIKFKP